MAILFEGCIYLYFKNSVKMHHWLIREKAWLLLLINFYSAVYQKSIIQPWNPVIKDLVTNLISFLSLGRYCSLPLGLLQRVKETSRGRETWATADNLMWRIKLQVNKGRILTRSGLFCRESPGLAGFQANNTVAVMTQVFLWVSLLSSGIPKHLWSPAASHCVPSSLWVISIYNDVLSVSWFTVCCLTCWL